TAAMGFMLASTNLVAELGIIMAILLGWQFTLAEFAGGPLMVAILALLFRFFLKRRMVEEARKQADRGIAGRTEGHAAMDMSITEDGSICHRIRAPRGLTPISHSFILDWPPVWKDSDRGHLR